MSSRNSAGWLLIVLALTGALLVGACRNVSLRPTSEATAEPTAAVTPTPPAPTPPASTSSPVPTVLPSPSPTSVPSPTATPVDLAAISAWVGEVCRINDDLVTGTLAITDTIPEPQDAALDAYKQVNRERQPLIEALLAEIAARLAALAPLDDGLPFHDALRSEMDVRIDAAGEFYGSVEAASTIEDYEVAVLEQAAAAQEATFDAARTMSELSRPVIDAIATVDDCRFFELEARALPRGMAMPDFERVILEDDLSIVDGWSLPGFEEGEVNHTNGTLVVTFDGFAGRQLLTPPVPPGIADDVRVESRLAMDGLGFSGVFCRNADEAGYAAQVTATGLLLLLRRDGDEQTTLARRVLAPGALAQPVDLALECAGGTGGELLLAAYIAGEVVAEFSDAQPPATLGTGTGLVAHTLGVNPSTTVFDSIRLLAPAD